MRDALLQGGGWPAMWFYVLMIGVIGAIFYLIAWRSHAPHAGESMNTTLATTGFWTRLRALIRKEFNQIRRDRRLAISLIVPPTLQILLFGFALDSTVSNLRLGVVDDSHTPESRELIATLTESKSFRLAAATSLTIARWKLRSAAAKLDAGVVIPYDFARDLQRGRPTDVQILLNAVNANTASHRAGLRRGRIQNYNRTLANREFTRSCSMVSGDRRAAPDR